MTAGARPRILLTGAAGQVGWELARSLAPLGEVVPLSRSELDLADLAAVRDVVRTIRPGVIVNAAAYTAVDRAETEHRLAFRVNAEAPGALAEEAARIGAALVHYSTDYVFDGTSRRPYTEADEPNPLNVYGESKLAGERAVAAAGGSHWIFRTSWVYATRGSNFLRTMLRLAREREELRVVDDQTGAPTWAAEIARGTAEVIGGLRRGEPERQEGGLYHLTAGGETTWYGFARALLDADPDRGARRCTSLVPIPSSEFPTPARRPAYSLLDNAAIRRDLGVELPHWSLSLSRALAPS
jgi:dTDP-4-dehydrorhamnose reductase